MSIPGIYPYYMRKKWNKLVFLLKKEVSCDLHTPYYFPELNKKDCVGVYAGYVNVSGTSILNVDIADIVNFILKFYKPGVSFIFDNMHEGGIDVVVDRIHEAIEIIKHTRPESNLSTKDFYYFSGAINTVSCYDWYCKNNSIVDTINVGSVSTWEHYIKNNGICNTDSYDITIKPKNFLCFNRVSRAHRVLLACMCIKYNLIEKSYYSFFPYAAHYGVKSRGEILGSLKTVLKNELLYDEIESIFNDSENSNIFPMMLNITPDYNKNFLSHDDFVLYKNSYLSVVTETFYFESFNNIFGKKINNDHSVFFSEKTFKPIAMKHPFILVSRPNSLCYLKQLGYKTFHPYINEEYDNIEDNIERMKTIVEELKRLNEFSDSEWVEWQKQVKLIVEHNYDILMSKNTSNEFVTERNYNV